MRVTPPPPLLVAQSMASLGRPLASPLLWSISTFSHEIYPPRLCFSRRFNLTVVRVLFTLLPRLIDHFRPSVHLQVPPTLPAPVRGSGAGGGGGDGGSRGAHPLEVFSPNFSQLVFLDVRRVFLAWEENRSWGAPPFLGRFRWTSTYGGRGSIILRPSLR